MLNRTLSVLVLMITCNTRAVSLFSLKWRNNLSKSFRISRSHYNDKLPSRDKTLLRRSLAKVTVLKLNRLKTCIWLPLRILSRSSPRLRSVSKRPSLQHKICKLLMRLTGLNRVRSNTRSSCSIYKLKRLRRLRRD